MSESAGETETVTPKEEAPPDWLAAEPVAPEGAAALREEDNVVPPTDEPTDDASEEVPDWLSEGDLDSDDAIAWLEQIAAKYDPNFQAEGSAGTPEEPSETPVAEAAPAAAAEEEEEEVEEGLPDWLKATEAAAEPVPAAVAEEEEEEARPDWLKASEPAAEAVPVAEEEEEEEEKEGLPDWLKATEAAAEPAPAAAAEEEEEEGLPDWLKASEPAAEAAPAAEEEEEEEEEGLPDWLKATEAAAEEAEAVPAATAEEEEEVPDWLKESEPAVAVEATPAASLEDEDVPEWLRAPAEKPAGEELPAWFRETEEEPEPASAADVLAASPQADEALSWLDEQVSAQGVGAEKVVSEALTPDQPPVAAPPPPDLEAEAEPVGEGELPDWLKDAGAQEAIASALEGGPEEELPAGLDVEVGEDELAWLKSALEAEQPAEAEGTIESLFGDQAEPTPAAPAAEEAEARPRADWLKGPEPAQPPAAEAEAAPEEPEEEKEVPPWLKEEPAPAPAEARKPAGMTDWLTTPTQPAEPAPPPAERPVVAPRPASAAPRPQPAPIPLPPELEGDYHEQLRIAREKLSGSAVEEALPYYENMIHHGENLDQTISDLSYLLRTEKKVHPRVHRVLGDALRTSGRLQDALEAYRNALDNI